MKKCPILGMERYIRKQIYTDGSVEKVREFLKLDDNRSVWSPIKGGPALSSQAVHHTSFTVDQDTLQSIRELIKS